MKKFMAFLLAILILMSFTACRDNTDNEETSTTKATDNEVSKFEQATKELVIATTIGIRYVNDIEVLNQAACMQDILGWYCARQQLAGGKDYLTQQQVDGIQKALRPGLGPHDLTDRISSGSIITETLKGKTIYKFPEYLENYKSAFGNFEFNVTYPENYNGVADENTVPEKCMISVEVYDKDNNFRELFRYFFSNYAQATAQFPYSLVKALLPEYESQEPSNAGFDIEALIEANKLSTILEKYGSVKGSHYMANNYLVNEWYRYIWNDVYISNGLYKEFDEPDYYFGYDDLNVEYTDAHYVANVYPYFEAGSENTSYRENAISYMFDLGKIEYVEEVGDLYRFRIVDYYYNSDDISALPLYEVRKSDLTVVKIVWNQGAETEYTVDFEYGVNIDDYGFKDGWDENPMRTVKVIALDGTEEISTSTYTVPYNLEITPSHWENFSLYSNKDLTVEYKYPGDGVDYTVYITNTVG